MVLTTNRAILKSNAKSLLINAKPSPLIMGVIYFLLTYLLNTLSSNLTGVAINIQEYMNAVNSGDISSYFYDVMSNYHPGAASVILSLVIQVALIVIRVGFLIFILNTYYHRDSSFYNILDGFGMFGKAFLLYLIMAILIFLWSLLLIIPGIIAFYRYRMAPFIMIENPQLSAIECIKESKRIMSGHKNELFLLDLSFIGWLILEIIPLVSAYVAPYMNLAYAGFYDAVKSGSYSGSDYQYSVDENNPFET